ncbi:MAG TPA: TIGR03667 family PPOX class F420-dependent oxidoreductase [Actinomycetota bacterium]
MALDLEGIAGKLQDEVVVWLTTVSPEGQPQSVPVWFLWRDDAFLIFSQPDKPKLRNLAANPRVSLHFRGTRNGEDIATLEGEARRAEDHPPADQVPPYVEKYAAEIEKLRWTPQSFAADYSQPILVRPTRVLTW